MSAKLRLVSGLILFIFVLGHFLNHALGIISLGVMNDALKYSISPWRHPVGEAILVGALVIHAVLALTALYNRRSLRMGKLDLFQMVSGFLIPCLLAVHVLGTRGLHEAFGVVEGYEFTLFGLWIPSQFYGILNIVALLVVWFHACLGWHNWLKFKSWYSALKPYALILATLIPALALAGYASASLRVSRLSGSEKWVERLFKRTKDQIPQFQEFIDTYEPVVISGVLASIALVLAASWVRGKLENSRSAETIQYRDSTLSKEHAIAMQKGASLLEHFRIAGIPHASVCGGRGRCSTCRVRIDAGHETLSEPGPTELRVLERIGAPVGVRLACQTVPASALTVTALMLPNVTSAELDSSRRVRGGEERDIAVMFIDIREFTKLTETKLPYDTAFLLNRYFSTMGEAIEESGGHVDKFIGDGVMALFGVDSDYQSGCKSALEAAARISRRLDTLNRTLEGDLPFPLRIGMGIHSGTAIIGEMGYGSAVNLTAIGDVVNTASRLETMTKVKGVQLLVSEETVVASGMNMEWAPLEEVEVRGREGRLAVRIVEVARTVAG